MNSKKLLIILTLLATSLPAFSSGRKAKAKKSDDDMAFLDSQVAAVAAERQAYLAAAGALATEPSVHETERAALSLFLHQKIKESSKARAAVDATKPQCLRGNRSMVDAQKQIASLAPGYQEEDIEKIVSGAASNMKHRGRLYCGTPDCRKIAVHVMCGSHKIGSCFDHKEELCPKCFKK